MKISVPMRASPADVYKGLLKIGDWWNPDHTFSHNAHNLGIEEKAMGCFCEKLPGGGAVRHMEVINFVPGKALVMSGALGPLQALASVGTMSIQISAADGGSKVEVTYAVAGYLPGGLTNWAVPVDGVLKDQFTRLKAYVEK